MPPPLAGHTLDLPSSDPAILLRVRFAAAASSSSAPLPPSTSQEKKNSCTPPALGLLLLHAYPRLGGSSADPVVAAVYHAARKSGRFALVVRYDQRGAGASGGGKGVWGWADAADAAALAGRMRGGTLAPGAPPIDRLYVCGYSWGGVLGALGVVGGSGGRGSAPPPVAGWVGVSPPLGGLPGLALRTGRACAALGSAPSVPGLVILGDRDQFCSVRAAREAVCRINEERRSAAPAPTPAAAPATVDLAVVEGTDHFWGAATPWCPNWGEVAGSVLGWIEGVEGGRG